MAKKPLSSKNGLSELREQIGADFKKEIYKVREEFDAGTKKVRGDFGEKIEKLQKTLRRDTQSDFERYSSILYEKFRDEAELVAEHSQGVKEMVQRMEKGFNATFEMVGRLATDIEIVKQDVAFIKNGLKKKVDQEEFEALERRVAIVEAKFTPKQT